MSSCDHNCESCASKDCSSRTKESLLAKNNSENHIKKIFAVHSGKGGVGKSFVSTMLATQMAKKGYKVGILDADITGPSIPTAFGLKERLSGSKEIMYPAETKLGVKVVSINLLLDNPSQPVAWRGPILGNVIKQFYSDVKWGEIDYLFVDMPPGTGDVALTVFQSLPIDGVIIVSTPQDLVSMIVGKAVNLAAMMDIEIVGLVENMAYMNCPCCNNPLYPFGPSQLASVSEEFGIKPLASLPILPEITKLLDKGQVEDVTYPYLDSVLNILEK